LNQASLLRQLGAAGINYLKTKPPLPILTKLSLSKSLMRTEGLLIQVSKIGLGGTQYHKRLSITLTFNDLFTETLGSASFTF